MPSKGSNKGAVKKAAPGAANGSAAGQNRESAGTSADRIVGKGEMAELVRAYDWGSTSLGPIESWSKELVTIVNLTLSSSSPARTMWGPELILIYNDAYRPIPGPRHPAALGKSAREVYSESWPVVGPLLEKAIATGETLFYEKLLVPLPVEGGMRDSYLNYSFNPIFEDGKLAGLFGSLHDVTGEVTALRQLKESEARASRILQSIGDAVIVTDADARVTAMNHVAETLTGWEQEQAKGHLLSEIFRIVSEGERKEVESPADKVKRTGSIVALANHTILISKDGTDHPIDDSGAPIFDDDGKLTGIVLVFRDIEERRGAERENERITELYRQVLEVTSDAIVGLDRNFVMTYANPRALEIYNKSGRDIIGRNVWEEFPDAAAEGSPFWEHYRRAMDEGVAGKFDTYYPAPLNFWLHVEVYPTRAGIVTFSRDITEEVTAREALRAKSEEAERQKREIESVYKTAPIGLALFDTEEFRYLRLNDRQADFFGMKPEQIVGKKLTEMAPIEGLRELFEQVREGEPVVNYPLEGELTGRPGEHRYWTVSYFPVMDEGGKVQAITAASLEITQQRKAEYALIQSEKLAVVGRLAASIAHEINNPLESVTNLLYLATHSDDSGKVKEYIDTAERELRRVSAIANQTLRFHKQATSPREITCKVLMDSVISIYQGRILNSGVQVEERSRAKCVVRCFEGEIRQVLSNLIGNAIDAMHSGGGRMLLRTREGTNWRTGKRGVKFTVADTGSGIAAADLEKIFEPFFTTKGIGGTGLGLWVSKEIVERHGGELSVRSSQAEGRSGTVFSLFLPFEAVDR
jgi:PAS domain S-box-containing protein